MKTKAGKNKPSAIIIVAIDNPTEGAINLFNIARRKAQISGLAWEAVYVRKPLSLSLQADQSASIEQLRTIAEQGGATFTEVKASSIYNALVPYIEGRKQQGIPIASLMIGKPISSWQFLKPTGLVNNLKKLVGENTEIIIHPLQEWYELEKENPISFEISRMQIIYSLFAVILATFFIELLHYVIPQAIVQDNRNKPIIYMTACAFIAGRYGLLPGFFTAVISFLVLNLIYISPSMGMVVPTITDAANLALFLISSFIIAVFFSQKHKASQTLAKQAGMMKVLFQIHHVTLAKNNRAEIINALRAELSALLGLPVTFFLPKQDDPTKIEQVEPTVHELTQEDEQALQECWEQAKKTGIATPYHAGISWYFEPLLTAQGEAGVLGIYVAGEKNTDPFFSRLLTAMANQTALIIERAELEDAMEEGRIRVEREKLRSMLLSSVSHDLKTPLASVIGSLSVYRTMADRLPAEQRTTLINNALDEAQRLDSFITNILDMTRIESGDINLKKDWVSPDFMIKNVGRSLRARLQNHQFVVQLLPESVEVCIDQTMTEQVLQNVIDNAVKYTPVGSSIELSAAIKDKKFQFQVRDQGAGIPRNKINKVFDKYVRLRRGDKQVAGTGLGLAISKAIMTSQGGEIIASNHPDGGAVFTIILPKWRHKKTERIESHAA